MTYMSAEQTIERPSRERHGVAARPALTCTEPMLLAVIDHLSSPRRPLAPAITAQLAPVGGVTYLAWLFSQLIDRLAPDERAILAGLLRHDTRMAIGDRLGHDRNWVTARVKTRLVPQLVALINAAVAFPCFSHQAMLGADGR